MASDPPTSRDNFHVAIICALATEYNAVSLVFDQFWDDDGDKYGRAAEDNNQYTTGRIGKHNVVLVLLPHIGKINAASAAVSLRSSYRSLRLALLVGICGAVPFIPDGEVLLGDVVISHSIVQYDFGRQYSDRFVRKDMAEDNLGRPNKDIRGLLTSFETYRIIERIEDQTSKFLQQLQDNAVRKKRIHRDQYKYPGIGQDLLFETDYRHKHRNSPTCVCCDSIEDTDLVCDKALGLLCDDLGCEQSYLVTRDRHQDKQQLEQEGRTEVQNPTIHIGAIASGDTVMKSARHRDTVAKQENVIGFEMEGAGMWEEVPCVVVKGVCDYADSHKHKGWQNFAAATAASAAKAILERYIRTDETRGSTVRERGHGLRQPNSILDDGSEAAHQHGANIQFGNRQPTGRSVANNSIGSNTQINQGDVGGNVTF